MVIGKRRLGYLAWAGDAGAAADNLQGSKRVLKVNTRERLAQARVTGPRLCVDLSVADCMSPKAGGGPFSSQLFPRSTEID